MWVLFILLGVFTVPTEYRSGEPIKKHRVACKWTNQIFVKLFLKQGGTQSDFVVDLKIALSARANGEFDLEKFFVF